VAKQLQLRKGTATEHNTFTGANGEVTVDTTNKTLRVHDGTTAGGTQLATLTGATTSTQGVVKLNDSLTSTSITEALTAAQGKVLKDSLNTAITSSFGVGQTWQDLTSSRASGVTYTNTTGKPIQIYIMTGTESTPLIVGGVTLTVHGDSMPQIIVPHTVSYRFDGVVFAWAELR
jgi:hypothetical protein